MRGRKINKISGKPSPSTARRLLAPEEPPNKKTHRRVNFEAREAARVDRATNDPSYARRTHSPEQEALTKTRNQKIRHQKCVCGHRGDKHTRWISLGKKADKVACFACPRGECNRFQEIPRSGTGGE